MTDTTNTTTTGDESKLNQDYIPAEDVARRYSGRDGIEAIVRDADDFGNIINSILIDGDTYSYAIRRDDCRNEDGTLPQWSVKATGALKPVSYPDAWAGASESEITDWTLNAVDIEDIGKSDGNLVVDIHDPTEIGFDTVEFEFVVGR